MNSEDDLFYVIDYDAGAIEGVGKIDGVGKFVLKPQKIEPPKRDRIRGLFREMRDIARDNTRFYYNGNRFFDKPARQEKALIFRIQGMFMKDFTDNYDGGAELSSYFPDYQMMSYEQLRTYFTWRTRVRGGNIADTSLSYAFLYIYELLNNIGAADPEDGFQKLIDFWKVFRAYNNAIDKYVLKWFKDYHIYYNLRQPFKEFAITNNLTPHYPEMSEDENDDFTLFCGISKYDIRQSAFFTEDRQTLIADCFRFVIARVREALLSCGFRLDGAVFGQVKKAIPWQPFRDALFHPFLKQPDRQVVLARNEIYICRQNAWTTGTTITAESGRQLVAFIMKQTESVLRNLTGYKYKLSANIDKVNHNCVAVLQSAGLPLETVVSGAVTEYYRNATKTVVNVDISALSRIRQEALQTQEKLIVPEPEHFLIKAQTAPEAVPVRETADVWSGLKSALNETELRALSLIAKGVSGIKQFARENNLMPEILQDGINGKAMDFIGDNLIDDDSMLYEDYAEKVKGIVSSLKEDRS